MKTRNLFAAGVCLLGSTLAAQTVTPMNVQVEGGIVQFDSETNLSVVSVHGKTNAMRAEVKAARTAGILEIEQIQASLPVKSISTGMGLRDEHMRKYIFTQADGSMPDLQFKAANWDARYRRDAKPRAPSRVRSPFAEWRNPSPSR